MSSPAPFDIEFNATDPWATSLRNNREFLLGTLDAAGVRSVTEVGAYAGDLTKLLLDWARPHGGRVIAIDPDPQPELDELDRERDDLSLVRATSLDALPRIDLTEAYVIDGDHTYYTVSNELRLIAERFGDRPLPLLLFHDVGWPHGRRDSYEAVGYVPPEELPGEVVEGGGLFPNDPGIRPGGLPMRHSAAREGGPRNGVLTAIEDFVAGRDGLRLAIVPSFFGFGVLWALDAPYAARVAEFLDPWDRNPVLQRMEDSRIIHLAAAHEQLWEAARWRDRDERKRQFLHRLLQSRSFRISQWISRVAQRGEPAFTEAEIRSLLDET